MIKLFDNGAYLLHGTELVEDNAEAGAVLASKIGSVPSKEEASKNTLAYGILEKHNTSDNMDNLKIKFDKMTSHDITFVESSRQPERQDSRNFLYHVYLQTATIHCVQ